jgi:hypothetical protein
VARGADVPRLRHAQAHAPGSSTARAYLAITSPPGSEYSMRSPTSVMKPKMVSCATGHPAGLVCPAER